MLLLLLACTDPTDPGKPPPASDDTAAEPHTPSDNVCERVRAGPAGEKDGIVALSEAHADIRLFGPAADFPTADAALVAALADATPDLAAYADASGSCLLPAEGGALPSASVQEKGGKWWITPGTGAVEVPDDGKDAVLDLRGLPHADGLAEALEAALAAAAATPISLPDRRMRRWSGFVDQWYSPTNVYETSRERIDGDTIEPARAAGTLYVVTEDRMAPAAAELAATVALGGHGHVVGVDLLVGVAEMAWSAIGDQGVAWQARTLGDADEWPDVVPAVLRTDDPDGALDGLDLGAPTPAERGADDRPVIQKREPYDELPVTTADVATWRAGLVVAHGGLRRFYPYFGDVGDLIDDRLLEVLAEDIDPTDPLAQRRRVGRLGNALSDGHMFFGVSDAAVLGDTIAGYLPVVLTHVDGRPVVVRSSAEGLDPGDTIEAIDGVSVDELLADWHTWHGGATDGYRLDLATRELQAMAGPQVLTLRDPDGAVEDVTVEPVSAAEAYSLPYTWILRDNGTLEDLGRPDIAYLNLGSDVTTDIAQVDAVLATDPDALVVDMRGYPAINHYTVLERLVPGTFYSPQFRVPEYVGPGEPSEVGSFYELAGDDDAYAGRIVLLVSPVTVSAAENFAQMLVGAGRVEAVIGSPSSAGTNGNITGMTLPGGFFLSFTGMEVLNPDGSRFHGIGIQADLVVEPTAADWRDGRDPVLEAAASWLSG